MDSLTHLLVAATMAEAGVGAPQRWRSLALLSVAAVAPDAEVALRAYDPAVYVRLYHGPLHSLAGATVLAAALAVAYARLAKDAPGPALRVALAGCGAHLFLDLFHGYGEQLLWPFTARRYAMVLLAQV